MAVDKQRLEQIRAAVEKDGANLEDAYADRSWLLTKHDQMRDALTEIANCQTERQKHGNAHGRGCTSCLSIALDILEPLQKGGSDD